MKNARTVTDLDSAFHKRVVNLVQEYDEIKDRKGKVIYGVFVKEADL